MAITTLDAHLRRCAAGCGNRIPSRPGRGRRSVYCSADCRRAVEHKARRDNRAATRAPKGDGASLAVRIKDPVALSRGWILWRYPEGYRPKGDAVSPSGFRVALAYEAWTVKAVPVSGFPLTVLNVRVPVDDPALWECEIRNMARWITGLPPEDQRDFACRALEAVADREGLPRQRDTADVFARAGSTPVKDVTDYRPDPVTLPALRRHYGGLFLHRHG